MYGFWVLITFEMVSQICMQRQTSWKEERQVEIVCPDSAYILYRMQQEFNGPAYAKTLSIPLPDYTAFTGEEDYGHTRL